MPLDDQGVLEGYKWIFSILQVGFDVYVWADPARPRFVDIVGPLQEVGRRQRRRLLPVRADRSRAARTACADARATPSTCRSPSTAGPTTAATPSASSARSTTACSTSTPTARFEFSRADGTGSARARRGVRDHPRLPRRPDDRTPDRVAHRGRRPAGDLPRGRRRPGPPVPRRAHVDARAGQDRPARRSASRTRRRALPGADHDLRLGGGRRRVRDGQLRSGRRRGAGDRGPLARVRVLEPVPVEPVPAHLQLRLRAGDDQRRAGAVRAPTARGASSSPIATPGSPNWVSTAGHPRGRLWFRWFHPGGHARAPDDDGRQADEPTTSRPSVVASTTSPRRGSRRRWTPIRDAMAAMARRSSRSSPTR